MTDPHLASRFNAETLDTRAPNKAALQQHFELKQDPERLLFAVVSRMAWQKGLDLLADAVPALVARGAQLAVLGTGDPDLERRLTALAQSHAGQVGCIVGYDEDLAHLIQAGADALLVPSRFEPCGLTQLCAMRYGAMPIGSKVGGLADTIVDTGQTGAKATGLTFLPVTRESLETALRRAADLWSDRAALAIDSIERDAGRRVLGEAGRRVRQALRGLVGGVQKLGIAGLIGTSAAVRQARFLQAHRKAWCHAGATGRGTP